MLLNFKPESLHREFTTVQTHVELCLIPTAPSLLKRIEI